MPVLKIYGSGRVVVEFKKTIQTPFSGEYEFYYSRGVWIKGTNSSKTYPTSVEFDCYNVAYGERILEELFSGKRIARAVTKNFRKFHGGDFDKHVSVIPIKIYPHEIQQFEEALFTRYYM